MKNILYKKEKNDNITFITLFGIIKFKYKQRNGEDTKLMKSKQEKALSHMNSIVNERPLDINIETTNFCPLKCVFCLNRKVERSKEIMPMDLFGKICADYYAIGGGAIGISSMQSDIFSDELLMQRLEILKKYSDKFYVYTTTNVVSCVKFSDEQLKTFLETFDYLVISMGGVEKEEYKIMYGVDAFDVVEKQLERFKRIIDENNLDIKIDIGIRTFQKDKIIKSSEFKKINSLFPIYDVKDSFFSWYGMIKETELPQGANLILSDNTNKAKDCVVSFATLSINVNGQVIGCGCIDWEAKNVIGDTNNNSILEIWQSDSAVSFRKAFSTGKIPFVCRECGLYIEKDECFSNTCLEKYQVSDGLYYDQ